MFPVQQMGWAANPTTPADLQQKAQTLEATGAKPRIVVFWGSLGMGHETAAMAFKQDIQKAYPQAEVVLKDVRDFMNPIRRAIGARGYTFMTKKTPGGYDRWFKGYMEQGATIDSPGNLPTALKHHPEKMLEWLKETNPTEIISVYNPATEALINLRDQGELLNIPVAQFLTDYTDTVYFRRMGERVDMSFVPDERIRQSWMAAGLPESKVRTSGIPVNPQAFIPMTESQRKEFLVDKGLDPEVKTVVLVSGSAGVGDFLTMVKSMAAESNGQPIQIVAICARNTSHFKNLIKLLPRLPANVNLKVLGLVPQAELLSYLKASNLVVTKTGGLSSTEITTIQKPVIYLDINGGQETYNSQFFSQAGMAIATKDQAGIGKEVQRILNDEVLQRRMVAAQAFSQSQLDRLAPVDWTLSQQHTPLIPPLKLIQGGKSEAAVDNSKGNKALFLDDETEVGSARWDFIKNETGEIFMDYLLFDFPKVGNAMLSLLWHKAKTEGVKSRIVIDGWGPEVWDDCALRLPLLKVLADAGVEIKVFNPVNRSSFTTYLNFDSAKRDHGKILYLKDQKVAALGDRNVQNINFRLQKTSNKTGLSYRSTEVFVQGNATQDVSNYLEDLWQVAKSPDLSTVTPEQMAKAERDMERYYKRVSQISYPSQDWTARM